MKSISMALEQLLPSKQLKSRALVLGERELDVMKTLWNGNALSAQEVLQDSGNIIIVKMACRSCCFPA